MAGQLASLVGTWMQTAAQMWLVYRLTGSAWLLGVLGFATQIPIFLVAPLGGVVSDTFDRRRVLIATQAASMVLALLLAGLTLSERIEVTHLLAIALALGCVNAFDIPARQAFLTDMVGRDELPNAVALNSSMFHAARLVGPAIGGLVIAAVGEGWCFLLNGFSFMAVLASLMAIDTRPAEKAAERSSAFRNLTDGLRFVLATRPVRSLLLLLALMSLTAAPYSVLLPVFAKEILGVEARGLGLLMAASGAGALAAALYLASRPQPERLPSRIAGAAAMAALCLIVLSQSRVFGLSLLTLVPVGFGLTTQLAGTNTLLQLRVPDALRGRVMSVYAMMFMGLWPVGALVAGRIAEHLGVSVTVAASAALYLAGTVLFVLTGMPAVQSAES